MPTFCPQCGAPRPEAVCPIHGAPQHPSGIHPVSDAALQRPIAPQQPVAASIQPRRVTRSLPRPISTVMDPLQPLPRRPKKSTAGAWLLAIGLAILAAAVLWLNLRPRRVSLQQRVEQARDHARALLSLEHGDAVATDPAIRQAGPAAPPTDRPAPAETRTARRPRDSHKPR